MIEEFRAKVEDRLREKGLSKSELARRSGVDRAYIYALLSEEVNPTVKVINAICEPLDLRLAILSK